MSTGFEGALRTRGRDALGLRRSRTGRRYAAWLQLAPASAFFALFFFVPVGVLVAYSFYTYRDFQWYPELTVDNYFQVVTSDLYRAYFFRTLKLAAITSAIVLILAYALAYVITFVFPRRRQLLYFLVLVSLFGGYLVRIYAWRTMLGREGLINEGLLTIGLIDEPLRFFLNSQFAIVLTMVNFLLPLGVLPIYAAMQNVSPRLVEASRDLGSGTLQAARRVVLPLTMRGVRAALAFTFIASAAEWVTPLLVGSTRDQLVGNQIAYEFGTDVNWPLGAALAMTLIAVVVVIVVVVLTIMRRWTR